MTFRNIIIAAGLLGGVLGGFAPAQAQAPNGPAEVIATRQAGMKHTGAAAGAVKKALDAGGDLMAVAASAQEVADWGRKIPSMFPPGSDAGAKTRALPAIWSDKAEFDKLAGNMAAAADTLAAALKANDAAAAKAAFAATGAACAACHRTYRAPA